MAVHLDDVRAVAAGQDRGLAGEPGTELGMLRQLDGEHLERHAPPEVLLDRLEDDTHAARSQLAGDPVGTELVTLARDPGQRRAFRGEEVETARSD
jgi:hypothetical protein